MQSGRGVLRHGKAPSAALIAALTLTTSVVLLLHFLSAPSLAADHMFLARPLAPFASSRAFWSEIGTSLAKAAAAVQRVHFEAQLATGAGGAAQRRARLGLPRGSGGSDQEPVTLADKASHAVLATLGRPGSVLVISEEGLDTPSSRIGFRDDGSTLVLQVDPLDGTKEFTEGLTDIVSVQICVTRCGTPLAGLVYFPFTGRLAAALPDGSLLQATVTPSPVPSTVPERRRLEAGLVGAFSSLFGGLAPERLAPPPERAAAPCACPVRGWGASAYAAAANATATPSASPAPSYALLAPRTRPLTVYVTRSHFHNASRSDGRASLLDLVNTHLPRLYPNVNVVRVGGAGYKLAAVAEGSADAYVHDGPLRTWDVCPGAAVVTAAGGHVADWLGRRSSFCLPPLYPKLGGGDAGASSRNATKRIGSGSGSGGSLSRGVAALATSSNAGSRGQSSSSGSSRSKSDYATAGVVAAREEGVLRDLLALIATDGRCIGEEVEEVVEEGAAAVPRGAAAEAEEEEGEEDTEEEEKEGGAGAPVEAAGAARQQEEDAAAAAGGLRKRHEERKDAAGGEEVVDAPRRQKRRARKGRLHRRREGSGGQ